METLNTLRHRTARFRRVALHLHSPDSHDWGRGGDAARNQRAQFLNPDGAARFARELRPHFDVVSITDHMRCDFATRSSAHIRDEDFVVLPGMEINFRPEAALGFARIHLLVILPERSTTEHFARLFHNQSHIPEDAIRTGQEEIRDVSLRDCVRRVHDQEGICIAAHVDIRQGVRCRFRQTAVDTIKLFCEADDAELERENDVGNSLKQYLFDSGLDAVEITRAADARHYRWVSQVDGKERWIPTILTFDAHCVEQFNRPDRITHIKMTHLGLAGLKGALAFPDTRVRFPENLPSPPSPRLLGVQIVGEEGSFFKDVVIAFAENLNCIIGIRGSGKSTVVEALRYVFGYNRTLRELGKLEEPIRSMQDANLNGSLIRVIYRTSTGEERVLTTTFDEKSDYATKVYTTAGDFLEVADVEASGDYPLRLFGWSEIETLGRTPARQRDLRDRLISELAPILRGRGALRGELRANRATINKCVTEVQAAFERNDGEIRRFKEFSADFNKLNTPEVQTLFSALDLANDKKRLYIKLRSNAQAIINRLNTPDIASLQSDLESILSKGSQELRDWWLGAEIARLGLISTEEGVRKALREAVSRLESFLKLVANHLQEVERELETLQSDLRARFAADTSMQKIADLRSNAEQRLRRVASLRRDYQLKHDALLLALKERERIADELVRIQNEIAGVRSKHNTAVEGTLNRFLVHWMRVSIDFKVGGDVEQFAQKLKDIFGAKSNQAKKIRRMLETLCTPVSFAKLIRSDQLNSLIGQKTDDGTGATLEFNQADADACADRSRPFEHDEAADVEVLTENGARLQLLLDIQEVSWDDYEAILLNGGPVNDKSPGQRSSAMLPLIALSETTPLIIDQPEDNLDKRLIGNVLVNVLAELKEKRQIIVCTHDPNILVGGDAEQVIVLDAESDRRGKVADHGSIDNENIVRTVVDLLEGGADAFEARRKRYSGRAGVPQ